MADADLVFTSFDRGRYDGAGERPALRPPPGACVEITTSTFGATGPYSRWRGGPLADWAAGGYLAITGWPDREPLIGPEHLCGYVAGYTAAIAAEAALHERRRTGRGRHVDLGVMESMLNVHQSTFSRLAAGIVRVRTGRYTELYPLVVRPCRSGYVSLGVVTDVEFDRLLIAIGRDDLVADERFRDPASRWEHRDALDAELDGFLGAATPTTSSTSSTRAAWPWRRSRRSPTCWRTRSWRAGVSGITSTTTVCAWCRATPCRARRCTRP